MSEEVFNLEPDLRSAICERNSLANIRPVKSLDQTINGFVYRIKANKLSDNSEVTFVLKTVDYESREFTTIDLVKLTAQCPYLVRIYDVHTLPDTNSGYLLMEDCKGSLEGKKFSERQVVKILSDISKGVKALHDQNVVHRDLKPGNILERHDGTFVLADFGIARKVEREMTHGAGTMYYQAPEVLTGRHYGLAADVSSFALTAMTLLTDQLIAYSTEQDMNKKINKLKCSSHMKSLLVSMLYNNPARRDTISSVMEKLDKIYFIIAATDELVKLKEISQILDSHCKNVDRVHVEIVKGIHDQLAFITRGVTEFADLCDKYNRGGAKDCTMGQSIARKSRQLSQQCKTFDEALSTHMPKLSDLPTADLNNMKAKLEQDLEKNKTSKLVAFLTGSGAGVAVGSGVSATLVAIPTALFGEAGVLMLAGFAFPPAAAILGGAAVMAVLGIGLAALIRLLVNKGKKKLLEAVTQLLLSVKRIQDLIPVLQVQLQKTYVMLDLLSDSNPNGDGELIDKQAIQNLRTYCKDMDGTGQKLLNITIPTIPLSLSNMNIPHDYDVIN